MLRNADPQSFSAVYVVCCYTDMRLEIDSLQPLERKSQFFKGFGIHLRTNTMANWMIMESEQYLSILYDELHNHLSASTEKNYWPVFGKDADNVFETTILPFLIDIERYKWSQLITESQKKCHEIEVGKLNRKAQKRLDDLYIETEKVLVLHLQGQHCLYGYLFNGIFHILWYDTDHGDNEECVCRSFKKGDKKKHQR